VVWKNIPKVLNRKQPNGQNVFISSSFSLDRLAQLLHEPLTLVYTRNSSFLHVYGAVHNPIAFSQLKSHKAL